MSSKSSPSPSPTRDSVEMQRTETNGSGKDGSSSLKRVREGSLEPTQAGASIPDPVATKKNRIGSSSKNTSGPNDIAEVEGEDQSPPAEDVEIGTEGTATTASRNEEKPVGEVRKKVEKMSYEEGKENPASAVDVEIEEKEVERPNGDDSWEKIDKEEVEGSNGDSLKRKALNRSESSYAQEADDVSSKRAKDVAEEASEESKPDKAPSPKKTQKTFSSFASSASPFAALKSPSPAPTSESASTLAAPTPAPAKKPQATFGSFSGASSPFASAASPAPPSSSTPISSQTTETETTSAPAKKPQSTFGAFSSSSSPFATTKSTSAFGSAPVKGSAFGTYSSTSSAFSTKKSTPVEGEQKSEAGPSNFGDILQESGGDDGAEEEKVEMQEQDVTTGEEDEETVFQTRAKLYTNDRRTGWKERGVGLLKLNVNQSDGSGARLVMRADGVLRLILNSRIYKGITTYPDGKMVRMTLPEDGKMMIVCFRMSNTKQVDDFMEQVEKNQPDSWVPELKPTLD